MTKKSEPNKVSMELEFYEKTVLAELMDSRAALTELQKAIIPFAEGIAKRQRIWWDRVLESRGLSREGTSFTIENGTIVDQLVDKNKGE